MSVHQIWSKFYNHSLSKNFLSLNSSTFWQSLMEVHVLNNHFWPKLNTGVINFKWSSKWHPRFLNILTIYKIFQNSMLADFSEENYVTIEQAFSSKLNAGVTCFKWSSKCVLKFLNTCILTITGNKILQISNLSNLSLGNL